MGQRTEALAVLDAAARARRGCAAAARAAARACRALRRGLAGFRRGQAQAGARGRRAARTRRQTVEALFGAVPAVFYPCDTWPRCRAPRVAADTAQPIFIIGFPRSGTTLVEQILCSHSRVRPGGELPSSAISCGCREELLPGPERYPGNLARAFTADRHYVGDAVPRLLPGARRAVRAAGRAEPFFTDKMPFNEIHLPLLQMAFPHAKIVHVVRHPLDVCVSMLANNMTHGFLCAYRIEDIAQHLAAVFELVEHYARAADAGRPSAALRGPGRRPGGRDAQPARVPRPALRGGLPALSREPPFRPDPELRAGGRAAQRRSPRAPRPLRGAAAAVRRAPRAADAQVRLLSTRRATTVARRAPSRRGIRISA